MMKVQQVKPEYTKIVAAIPHSVSTAHYWQWQDISPMREVLNRWTAASEDVTLIVDCHSFPSDIAPDVDVCLGFNEDASRPSRATSAARGIIRLMARIWNVVPHGRRSRRPLCSSRRHGMAC